MEHIGWRRFILYLYGGRQNVTFQMATESRDSACDSGPNDCRIRAAAATAADQTESNQDQTARVRPRTMTRSISAVTLTETSKYNVTDNGSCNTDFESRYQNYSSLLAAASFNCIEHLRDKQNVDFQTVAEVKDSGATHKTKKKNVRCDNGPTDSHIRVVAATAADQTEPRPAQVFLPRKLTRSRSTMTRSISAVTLTEIDKIDKTDVTDNGPCKPDLEACCQNISALLAAAAAKNNKNGKYPIPKVGFIYGYMRVLFAVLQLEPECCVYSYIYIKRLQDNAGLKIGAGNWKNLLIVTLLLASKFVDDVTLTNKHFAFALNGLSLRRINQIERITLKALHWDIYVPISEYTMKYFELIQQPINPTTTCNWQVDADAIKCYFNVKQNQYYQFISHGLNLQRISPHMAA